MINFITWPVNEPTACCYCTTGQNNVAVVLKQYKGNPWQLKRGSLCFFVRGHNCKPVGKKFGGNFFLWCSPELQLGLAGMLLNVWSNQKATYCLWYLIKNCLNCSNNIMENIGKIPRLAKNLVMHYNQKEMHLMCGNV